MSLAQACKSALLAAGCLLAAALPAAERVDTALAKVVTDRLAATWPQTPVLLVVTVEGAVVDLSGIVHSEEAMLRAEQTAVEVEGVERVISRLRVAAPSESASDDVQRYSLNRIGR